MKRVITSILLILMLAGLLAGCNPDAGTSGSDLDSEDNSGKTMIAICIGGINHPVHRVAQMAFLTKAEDLGYRGAVSGLDEASAVELVAKFESTILTGAEGVLLWTGDDQYYEMMRRHASYCTFVVPHFAHDYLDTKSFISRNITSLATGYGKEAADFIVLKLTEKGITTGTIGLTQSSANVTENAATDAFIAQIKALGVDYVCAPVVHEGIDVVAGASKVTGVIQTHPDIVAAFGTTGGSCQTWLTAMQNTGKMNLVVVGVDYIEINQDYVRDGQIAAIVCQPLYEEAQMCVESLDEIFKGKDYTVSQEEWFIQLPAPLAYAGGEGENDINAYRDLINRVLEFFTY